METFNLTIKLMLLILYSFFSQASFEENIYPHAYNSKTVQVKVAFVFAIYLGTGWFQKNTWTCRSYYSRYGNI